MGRRQPIGAIGRGGAVAQEQPVGAAPTVAHPNPRFSDTGGNLAMKAAVADSLNNLDVVWDELFPAEQARIVSLLIERVVVSETGAEVVMRSDGLHSLVDELGDREERIAADG